MTKSHLLKWQATRRASGYLFLTLRDLGDSAPYFHNSSRPKFEDVVAF